MCTPVSRRGGPALAACLVFALIAIPTAQALAADSEAYGRVQSWLSAQKETTGFLPGPLELMRKMAQEGDGLSRAERSMTWLLWRQAQRPPVSLQQIADRVAATRESIKTIRLGYTVLTETASERGRLRPSAFEQCSFFKKQDKLLFSQQTGRSAERLGRLTVRAYDGKMDRTRIDRGPDRPPSGLLAILAGRAAYYDPNGPLGLQMLIDTEADLGMELLVYDLEAFVTHELACVLEKPDVVDGRKAIVCIGGTPPTFMVWLDPERNFAVLRVQTNRVSVDSEGRLVIDEWKVSSLREATDLVDCGDGVWLPRKIVYQAWTSEEQRTPGPNVLQRRTVEIQQAVVNQPIDDSVFTDIFPPGTRVRDTITGERFTEGDTPDAAVLP